MIRLVNHQSNYEFLNRIWLRGYFTKGERKRLNILVNAFNDKINQK